MDPLRQPSTAASNTRLIGPPTAATTSATITARRRGHAGPSRPADESDHPLPTDPIAHRPSPRSRDAPAKDWRSATKRTRATRSRRTRAQHAGAIGHHPRATEPPSGAATNRKESRRRWRLGASFNLRWPTSAGAVRWANACVAPRRRGSTRARSRALGCDLRFPTGRRRRTGSPTTWCR